MLVPSTKLTRSQVNAYGTYASYYMQHLMPDREMYVDLTTVPQSLARASHAVANAAAHHSFAIAHVLQG